MDDSSKIKILYIDDEKDNLETVKEILTPLGYSIKTETDPEIAMKDIITQYYDVVITDIMMPKVSGIEIAQAVHSTGRDTLVIIVTGFATVDTAIQSIKYGVYDYIQKPLANIDNVVKRAVEYLMLQRKNYELGNKIEETLTKVSLLHDISSILYQVADFSESSNMIFDTIIEGFKLSQIGILLKDEKKDRFTLFSSKNIDQSICENFKFSINDKINNQIVSNDSTSIIDIKNGELNISGKKIKTNSSLKSIILFPINFHINTLGYLIVFTNEQAAKYSNNGGTVELLEIFSNQIAPVVHSAIIKQKSKSLTENYISSIIENKLKDAKSLLSPVAFGLIRLKLEQTPRELSLLEDYISSAKNIIDKNISDGSEIYWQNKDTGLLVYPAADLFLVEKLCIEITEKVEQLTLSGNKDKLISMNYACVNFPQSGDSPNGLANDLWKHLFVELENSKEKIETL